VVHGSLDEEENFVGILLVSGSDYNMRQEELSQEKLSDDGSTSGSTVVALAAGGLDRGRCDFDGDLAWPAVRQRRPDANR
jgi:hypothetical protein